MHPKTGPERQEAFRRDFAGHAEAVLPAGMEMGHVDVWFQDEARLGQKGMLTRVWARRGSRPRVVKDHRYGYCQLFSCICPEVGTAVGHICGRANTDGTDRHLLDIAAATAEGRHALVVLDGAGRHRSKALEVPDNVSLLRLPPYSPELSPTETVFQFLKVRHFAKQVFESAAAVKAKVMPVWDAFSGDADRIRSLGTRHWAILAG